MQRVYTKSHEWLQTEKDVATVGITEYAAKEWGMLMFVHLPPIGSEVAAGEVLAEAEAIKTVHEIRSPVSGKILEVNEAVMSEAERINANPYAKWLCKVRVSAMGELLTEEEYRAYVATLKAKEAEPPHRSIV